MNVQATETDILKINYATKKNHSIYPHEVNFLTFSCSVNLFRKKRKKEKPFNTEKEKKILMIEKISIVK